MKQAAITGPQQATLIDTPDPQPFDNWVVVKIHAAPMCTEYKRFLSGEPTDVLGHEAAGEVVAVAQPGRVAVGDRVVVMPQYGCGECALCVSGDFIRKGLTLHGSWHYNLNDFPHIMQVIQASPLIDQLVSHTFPMSQVQEALICSASGEAAKMVLDPW